MTIKQIILYENYNKIHVIKRYIVPKLLSDFIIVYFLLSLDY